MENERRHSIDFIVIGAQKSGTTSLYEYLSKHPDIFMSAAKETEFFSNEKKYPKGLSWYFSEYFSTAPVSSVKGEASSPYMMYDRVPQRIARTLPHIKLIAILRNPIDRAYSHYRMSVMRGRESRSFEECVTALIARRNVVDEDVDADHDYVLFGEYGRILQNYLKWFDAQSIKIAFMEELTRQPEVLIKDIYRYLHVRDDFVPANLGRRYNVSGEEVVPGLNEFARKTVRWLKKRPLVRGLLPRARYEAAIFWTFTRFNIRPVDSCGPGRAARDQLKRHYVEDVALLKKLFGVSVPWHDFQ